MFGERRRGQDSISTLTLSDLEQKGKSRTLHEELQLINILKQNLEQQTGRKVYQIIILAQKDELASMLMKSQKDNQSLRTLVVSNHIS